MISKSDVPLYSTPFEVELPNGWSARVETQYDDDPTPPWERADGHGPVSGSKSSHAKRPGERVLNRDGEHYRYYDFEEAIRIARREGWSVARDGAKSQHGKRAQAAAAVEADFEFLRRWCNDEWHYINVIVTLLGAEGVEVGRESLCGIEDDTDYWREVAAELINDLAAGYVMPGREEVRQ